MQVKQLYNVINTTIEESFGDRVSTVKDAGDIVGLGDKVFTSATDKDVFLSKLTDVIGRTVVSTRAYTCDLFPFLKDAITYGAIYRKIKQGIPDAKYNNEWDFDNPSDAFDVMTIATEEYLYSKIGTWATQVTIPDHQLRSAFAGEESMAAFISSIFTQVEAAITLAIKSLNQLALASYVAEKVNLQKTQPTKTHAINVLERYNTAKGTTLTVKDIEDNAPADFYKFLSKELKMYKERLKEMSTRYNNTSLPRHTPTEYLDIYVLSNISAAFVTYLEADTFHKELVSLPSYRDVPYWQTPGLSYDFEDVSKVNIKLASDAQTTVNQTGILAVMMDRESITTMFELDTAETQRLADKKATNHIRTATRGMMVDLGENAVVFYAADPVVIP